MDREYVPLVPPAAPVRLRSGRMQLRRYGGTSLAAMETALHAVMLAEGTDFGAAEVTFGENRYTLASNDGALEFGFARDKRLPAEVLRVEFDTDAMTVTAADLERYSRSTLRMLVLFGWVLLMGLMGFALFELVAWLIGPAPYVAALPLGLFMVSGAFTERRALETVRRRKLRQGLLLERLDRAEMKLALQPGC